MLPCSAIASAWASTSRPFGVHSGERIDAGAKIGFLMSILSRPAFAAYRNDWKNSSRSSPRSTLGALVDCEGDQQNFFRRILGARNFSGQVSQLLALGRFPDLILISIGHNNVDWTWWCPPNELNQPEALLQRQCERVCENFAQQTRRLTNKARTQRHRVAIVVYGLINFEAYFKGREVAERLRAANPALYPHLENYLQISQIFSTGASAQFGSPCHDGE